MENIPLPEQVFNKGQEKNIAGLSLCSANISFGISKAQKVESY